MSVKDRMTKLLGNVGPAVEEEGVEPENAILQNLALAAASMGIDTSDDAAVDQFMADVRQAVTKDKSKLKSMLRRYTSAKAKTAAKGAVKAVS